MRVGSPELARQVTSLLDDISADGSYKLQLVGHSDQIQWSSGEPGSEKTWYTDPETTRLQRFTLKIVAPFRQEYRAKRKTAFRDRIDALLAQVGLAAVR